MTDVIARKHASDMAELISCYAAPLVRRAAQAPHGRGRRSRLRRAVDACRFFDDTRASRLDDPRAEVCLRDAREALEELRAALRYYGVEASEDQAASLIRAYDDNPDGKLDRLEFANLVKDLEGGHIRREGRTPPPYYGSSRYGSSRRMPSPGRPSARYGSEGRYGGASSSATPACCDAPP